jgi:hypothetical protein
MAKTPGYKFDEDGARRIVDAVRRVEKLSDGSPFSAYSKVFDDYMPGPVLFLVDLVQVGGVAGSGTTNCTFTYDIMRFGTSISLNTAQSPLFPRDTHTQYIAATKGSAYQDLDGSIKLAQAYEAAATEPCVGSDIFTGIS